MLSEEQYCYKIYTSLAKRSASIDNPLYGLPHIEFLQENLDPPSTIFQKSQPPLLINIGDHTMWTALLNLAKTSLYIAFSCPYYDITKRKAFGGVNEILLDRINFSVTDKASEID